MGKVKTLKEFQVYLNVARGCQTDACKFYSSRESCISFDNLVVRREYKTKDIILAKPKTGCKAVKTASFKDNVIQPFELLKSLTTTTTPAEILGVH